MDLIAKLLRKDLVIGLLKIKFEKDHLCSACQQGKQITFPQLDLYNYCIWIYLVPQGHLVQVVNIIVLLLLIIVKD